MDIVVCFRKRWMLFLSGIILLLFGAGVLSFITNSVFSYFRPMFEGFSLLFLFYLLPVLWQVFSALFLRQPALMISSTGIEVLPLNVPGRFFIRWSEIQYISVDQYFANKYLCIHPKDSSEYSASFPRFTRFFIRIWTPRELPLLSVPLLYLDKRSPEIFHSISLAYASEVDSYHIVLQA